MGAKAYTRIEEFLPIEGCCLEIGSERNEGSTTFLAQFCCKHSIPFYTVDFNRDTFDKVRKIPHCNAYCMKGEDFLAREFPKFNQKIGFAYLDNMDWITQYDGRSWQERINLYASYGIQLNNNTSADSHYDQVIEINNFISKRQIILIDDTWELPNNIGWDGKGRYAVPALLEHGYSVLSPHFIGPERLDGYALMMRDKNAT